MLNQVSVEAVYSATYVENYLDCVENLPDDLQRLISRMRELDVYYLDFGKDEPTPTENKDPQTPTNNTSSTTSLTNNERPTKRARRTRHDTYTSVDNNQNESGSVEHVLRSQVASTSTTSTTTVQNKKTHGTLTIIIFKATLDIFFLFF
ncbi:hypothetical protein FQR65_LT04907 [Abscondita terminalis]|nr:hypothetical protein FQR65_LT04907 [Abscondita terminalis]